MTLTHLILFKFLGGASAVVGGGGGTITRRKIRRHMRTRMQ